MIIKLGQYGLFAACDNFPNCRNTMKLNKFLYEILKKIAFIFMDGIMFVGNAIKIQSLYILYK